MGPFVFVFIYALQTYCFFPLITMCVTFGLITVKLISSCFTMCIHCPAVFFLFIFSLTVLHQTLIFYPFFLIDILALNPDSSLCMHIANWPVMFLLSVCIPALKPSFCLHSPTHIKSHFPPLFLF